MPIEFGDRRKKVILKQVGELNRMKNAELAKVIETYANSVPACGFNYWALREVVKRLDGTRIDEQQNDIKPIKIIGALHEIHFIWAYNAYLEFQKWRFREFKTCEGESASQKITIYDRDVFWRPKKKEIEIFTHETKNEFIVEFKHHRSL